MAFQTNVFRNGAWVTETIDLQTVLRGSTTNTSAVAPSLPAPPSCGILTRTVIDSPIARWVLPARLRSAHHNDVAFVGDRYVSINELRKDGQLQEVLRKNDFGCRIRNALVIGNKYEHFRVVPDDPGHDHIKSEDEDDDTHMADIVSGSGISSSHGQFPPHLLLLILESGSFVFLFIKRDDERDTLDFVASPFHNPARRLGHLGFHVAVDPRSRYIAVADAQNKFVVYELESMEAMGDQFILGKAIKPIRAHHPRAVQGTILKMEFLYPRPEDEDHVILLLIIAKADRSKMVIYEWERGDDLGQVLAEEKRGHRIAPEHRLPLLIIPLTVRSSFFAVSEHALGICKDPLQGPPDIETINPISHPASPFHHGTSVPLWTAWDRPVRRRRYYDTKDLIYLAREDGVIVFFEFNTTDILGAAMNVGSCNCNISTAFTTMYDAYSDVAIVAGDSGPGMVFQLKPREPLVELGKSRTLAAEQSRNNTIVQVSEKRIITIDQHHSPYLAVFPTNATGEKPELIRLTTDQAVHDAEDIDAMDIAPTIELVTTIVPVAESAEQTSVVVGTRSGHLITVQLTMNPFQHRIFAERLGTVALEVVPLETPLLPGSALVCCNDSLLLLRDFEARRPGHFATKHRVWATDLKHPATPSLPVISAACIPVDLGGKKRAPLVLLSGERMSFVELYLQSGPVPKTLPLPGTPSKVLYSQTLQCLVVALQIGKKPTVLFLDPETGEDLSLPQDKHGNATTFISGLGSQDDKIHAVYDWLFVKDGMKFHYLIVTTAGGRLLLVSPKKEESHDPKGNRRTRIRFSTKYRIKEKAPIYSIVGDGDSIIYCAGKVLHWDVLDSVEKRLVRKKTYELNSPAISLRMVNGKISALTLSDSLVIIDHKAENTHGEMTQIHADQVTRKSNHFFDVGDDADPELTWPVTLLTGMDRSFTAVWTPWKQPKRELELVAEGPLPASIRKLQRGRVRPEWVATEHVPRYGSIPSTVDGAEVLGICLDGSLMHFSLLNLQAWRFLRLIENLALRSPLLFPYSYEVSILDNEEYDAEAKDTPKSMKHINGDLLQQCIDKRVLQEIMEGDSNHDLLREYLDGLDDGKWTASFQEDNDPQLTRYFDLAYDILDYFLAPVL
ncbi:hypothetical protein CaCOL14_007862 [Colletotrichum acutatum]